jgi:hypothetical protein
MQLNRRLADIHEDKLLSTLQAHIDDGHEQAALQAIPDLQLRHPAFDNELTEIKQKLSDKLAAEVKVLDGNTAEVFRCVNCGGGLSRQSADTVHVICQYCGCDAEHPAQDMALERWNNALDLEANFTIGDFFTYEGRRWQAVGVQLFSGRVREYDSEDGWESSWSRYTSWWMLNEQRELAWLIDDGRRRYWADKHLPDNPALPDSKDRQYEHGEWTLEFAAGEFTYQPMQQERHNSAESSTTRRLTSEGANTAHRYYSSVESRLDEHGETVEIEFFRSRMIPHDEMLEGLGKDSAKQDHRRWRNTMYGILLALPLLAAAVMYLNRGGEVIGNTVAIASNDKAVFVQTLDASDVGQLYRVRGSLKGIRDNSWFGVDVGMMNSDDEYIYNKYIEFWRESGRDSDGPWSEASLSTSWIIRIDEPGVYRFVIDADEASTNASADFSIELEPNRTSTMPFILAAALTFGLMLVSRSKMESVSAAAASIALKLQPR